MNIKLILAASPTEPLRKNDPFMPLSLPLLAACAPGHRYTLIDLLWGDHIDYDNPTDLVGISVRETGLQEAFRIADEFHARGVKVVLGGPHPTAVPHEARTHADAVAVGEGEPLWPKIVKDAQDNNLADFYVCSPLRFDSKGKKVVHVSGFPELSNIPIAARHLVPRKYTFDTVFASRGCPIDCDFCAVSRMYGKQCRLRPIDNVVKEIDSFKGYYYLLDDTVFGRPATYNYYLDLYARIKSLRKKRYWVGQANLDAAGHPKGRDVIRAAAESGLIHTAIGIESINDSTLKDSGAIRKTGISREDNALEKIKEHIRFIQSQGILISAWFAVGYEGDTLDTFRQTEAFCREMDLIPAVFPIRVIPGTRLFDRLGPGQSPNPKLKPENLTREAMGVVKRSYTAGHILKRSMAFLRHAKNDRIHRFIFSLVLQAKMGKALDVGQTRHKNQCE